MRVKLLVERVEDGVSDVGIEIGDADDEQLVQDFGDRLHGGGAEHARMQTRLSRSNLERSFNCIIV